jgi:hypothetical protein
LATLLSQTALPAHLQLDQGPDFIAANARLVAALNNLKTGRELEISSPPLEVKSESDLIVTITWDWAKNMAEMSLSGSIPFRPGDNHTVPFPVPERSGSLPAVETLGDPLKDQADRREKFLKCWNKRAYAKDAVSELRREVGQLTDLIDLIPKNSDHIRGAINIVRKLIADDPGYSLIQVVAAMQDVPLPVFGNGAAVPVDLAPSLDVQVPALFVLSLRWGFRFESDLDCWLMQEGAVFNFDVN